MKRIFSYTISAAYNNCTLISFLKESGYSSQVITHLKRTENGILLNKTWARVRDILHTDDILTITLEEKTSSENIVASPLPLHIVYEDEDLMVINKPADMPIHPSQGNYDNTLANAVAYYYAQKEEPFTYRCINRLDRDTTGLLILAKHMYSASLLSDMVKNRKIHREYLAVAEGETPSSGVIDAPIGRVDGSTIERQVDYDFLYNPNYHVIKRQALHSHCLSFEHPITKEPLTFSSPLPDDMAIFFNNTNQETVN